MTLDYVADWQTRLRGRLAEQVKDKPHLLVVIDAFAAQIQELEDSGQAVGMLASIDPVTNDPDSPWYWIGRGAQLRVIGRRVGQLYTGETDEIYRLRLRARIKTNKSSGTPEHLYGIFRALTAGLGAAKIVPAPPAGLIFQVLDPPMAGDEVAVLIDFLSDGKVAGVRLWIEWWPAPEAILFAMAGGTGLGFGDATDAATGGVFAGALIAP